MANWGIEGVTTAEGFKNYLIDLQHTADTEETAETVAGTVMDIVAERSAVDMDIEELNHAKQKGRQTAKEMLALNLNTENPTDDECKEVFGGTVEQYIAYVIMIIINSFKSSVIGLSLLTESGKTITEADYAAEIVKRSAESGIPESELKEKMSYKDYVLQCGSDYLFELLKEFIKNYIYEQENKK